jgi:hypothetical protein
MDTKKMMKTAKVIDKILKVLRGIVAAGGIVFAVFLALALVFREKITKLYCYIDFGDISISLTDNSMKSFIIDGNMLIVSITIAFIYGITLLLHVIAPMKEGRPFEIGVSGQLRKLAWVTLVGGLISEVASQVASFTEMKAFDVTAMLNSAVVNGYSYNGTFNCSFLVGAVILFLLSYIFQYGEGLQRESDETL